MVFYLALYHPAATQRTWFSVLVEQNPCVFQLVTNDGTWNPSVAAHTSPALAHSATGGQCRKCQHLDIVKEVLGDLGRSRNRGGEIGPR